VPDLEAEPLAVRYRDERDGREHVTFLSFEARAAVQDRLAVAPHPAPGAPLLLPEAQHAAASDRLRATSAALIGAGNDVNVSLCRATGDFFRAWGHARRSLRRPAAAAPADGQPHRPRGAGPMKAVRVHAYHQSPVVEQVPDPEITDPVRRDRQDRRCGAVPHDLHIIEGQWESRSGVALPYSLGTRTPAGCTRSARP
jgi:hypothetical protein